MQQTINDNNNNTLFISVYTVSHKIQLLIKPGNTVSSIVLGKCLGGGVNRA